MVSSTDSYRRVHGEVSDSQVTWQPACDESGKEFVDIIYEKAVGEGIAKVWNIYILKISHLISVLVWV
jgi:naphthoate synthase